MSDMNRKDFLYQISEYLNDKKSKHQLGKLYTSIIKLDVNKLYESNTDVAYNVPPKCTELDGIANTSKFMTSLTDNNNTENGSYYAFGAQYRYSDHFKKMNHPMFVKTKYGSIKEELFEYFKRTNETCDKRILLNCQLEAIQSLDPCLKTVITANLEQKDIQIDLLNLWDDNKSQHDDIIRLITIENTFGKNLRSIITAPGLFQYLPDNNSIVTENIFLNLLDLTLQDINNEIRSDLAKYLKRMNDEYTNKIETKSGKRFFGLIDWYNFFELTANNNAIDNKLKLLIDIVAGHIFNNDWRSYQADNNYLKIIKSHFQLNANDLQKLHQLQTDLVCGYIKSEVYGYHIALEFIDNSILIHLCIKFYQTITVCKAYFKRIAQCIMVSNDKNYTAAIDALFLVLKVDKRRYYNNCIAVKCDNHDSLRRAANEWSNDAFHNGGNVKRMQFDDNMKQCTLMQVFDMNDNEQLKICILKKQNKIKSDLITYAKNRIRQAMVQNEVEYIKYQNNARCQQYIENATVKSEMNSVRKMKAIWYHGINEYHQINPNDPLQLDHIIAMTCYTNITELCTTFRETYRRITPNESLKKQKDRHSEFAHMGRLLYEAFVFYASKNSKVNILYHGMSVPLLFTTLFCTFDAPTSTTTASSVATSFGSTGIVVKFESSESSKYIRTLDMAPFCLFDKEEEHLIFETRL
eukprot:192361_1